jgi:peroxiredoxin Q/BCP
MTTTALEIGGRIPSMTLHTDSGEAIALRDIGKTLVLYFYPKDDTPGCTKQACELRDNWSLFEANDEIVLFGVSPQDEKSHLKFRTKHSLPFNLLVDEDHRLADELGFWVEKSMYGKKYWGIERSTVIVNADGTIRSIHRKVKPADHVPLLKKELGL